jgi:hypothetical protein
VKAKKRHDSGGDDVGAERGPEAGDDRAGPGFGLPDDHILGEISHEMGNYFHKLYYWTDYLRENTKTSGDLGAVDMLQGTVDRLEHFMRMSLEYFAPARLCFNKVRAGDLVTSLGSRLSGRGLRVEGRSDWAEQAVLADAGLIARALRTVVERVETTLMDESDLCVSVSRSRRREYEGLEIEFVAGGSGEEPVTLMKGIEMAVAEKFFQMHGGELFEREGDRHTLVVFLPIYS